MAKNILQDIVPPEKRSIRNIPVPPRRNSTPPTPVSPAPVARDTRTKHAPEEESPRAYSYDEESPIKPKRSDRRYSKKAIWIACVGAVVIVLFAFSNLFVGAIVRVQPRETVVSASGIVFQAYRGQGEEGVPYEIVTLTGEKGTSVAAEGEEEVEEKASGRIIVYNNFDDNEQRLIKNTRFETEDGLIYRINESIVVPGRTISDNTTVPGSIEVTVYADAPGDDYNIGLTDFTIPGFKSDSGRYADIYARSKTDMSGGFVGTRKKVAEEDLTEARAKLAEEISAALSEEIKGQIPENFISYPDGMFFSFEPLAQSGGTGDSVTINERGTLSAVIFNKTSFASYLAQTLAPEFASSPAALKTEELNFTIEDKEIVDLETASTFTFTIDGDVSLVSQFDKDRLAADLAGKSKNDIPAILEATPSIVKINATITPLWKRVFPADTEDIHIETVFEPEN